MKIRTNRWQVKTFVGWPTMEVIVLTSLAHVSICVLVPNLYVAWGPRGLLLVVFPSVFALFA